MEKSDMEGAIRERLGIPDTANRVLLFVEGSHWDPNWLRTSDEYYHTRIEKVLSRAIAELEKDDRRVFNVEGLFFVKMYWDRQPQMRERLRALVNSRRLRLSGCAMTTPHSLTTSVWALFQDYIVGVQWLRSQHLTQEVNVSYIPDSFGHCPAWPSLLLALGIPYTCIVRIDGMNFIGSDFRLPSDFPLAGSSAQALLDTHKSVDFSWQGCDGESVLAHWNAFTYFQGDLLAHVGIMRWMGMVLCGWPCRTDAHVHRRVREYIAQLGNVSRTPYMMVPLGCDFNDPIQDIMTLIDRFNTRHSHTLGVYAVSAGLDDYFGLIDAHRSRFPVMSFDPNPYWMGFYASRPEAKQRHHRVSRLLQSANALLCTHPTTTSAQDAIDSWTSELKAPFPPLSESVELAGEGEAQGGGGSERIRRLLARATMRLVLSNHHDFVTGTAPDRVWRGEQLQWLVEAEACVTDALSELTHRHSEIPPLHPQHVPDASSPSQIGVQWSRRSAASACFPPSGAATSDEHDGASKDDESSPAIITIRTPWFACELNEARGGCLTLAPTHTPEPSCSETDANGPACGASDMPSHVIVSYRDTGGLWRFGHEFRGGSFSTHSESTSSPVTVCMNDDDQGTSASMVCAVAPVTIRSILRFQASSPIVTAHLKGAAPSKHSVACRWSVPFQPVIPPWTWSPGQFSPDPPSPPTAESRPCPPSPQLLGIICQVVGGGVVARPMTRGPIDLRPSPSSTEAYTQPSYWPVASFAILINPTCSEVMVMFFPSRPACVALISPHPPCIRPPMIEMVCFRNAPREMAFGCLPVPAHPARGTDDDEHEYEYALSWLHTADIDAIHRGMAAHSDCWSDSAMWGSRPTSTEAELDTAGTCSCARLMAVTLWATHRARELERGFDAGMDALSRFTSNRADVIVHSLSPHPSLDCFVVVLHRVHAPRGCDDVKCVAKDSIWASNEMLLGVNSMPLSPSIQSPAASGGSPPAHLQALSNGICAAWLARSMIHLDRTHPLNLSPRGVSVVVPVPRSWTTVIVQLK